MMEVWEKNVDDRSMFVYQMLEFVGVVVENRY